MTGIRRFIIPISVLLFAFWLQTFSLGARSFHGDEFNSLHEAAQLGLNLNGFFYFLPLHFWLLDPPNEFWLRMPSVFWGAAAVAVGYAWTAQLKPSLALPFTLLFATSSFLIEYAQQVRFYSFFLFAALLCYWALTLALKHPTRGKLLLLILANLLVIGAHFFGILVIGSELLSVFLLTPRIRRRNKALLAIGVGVAIFLLLVFPPVRAKGYELLSVITNNLSREYTTSRGLSLANFAKIPITFFAFGFGQSVYPLDWRIVIPGVVLFAGAGVLGIRFWGRERGIGAAFLVSLAVFPILLYLVFDPLATATLQGASPHYLIFVLPFFYLLLAGALTANWRWLLIPLLLVQFAALGVYWSYGTPDSDGVLDWRAQSARLQDVTTTDTQFIIEGRAGDLAKMYLPKEWHQESFYDAQRAAMNQELPDAPRVILISANFYPDVRADLTHWIRQLETKYTWTGGWVQYPQFVYIFDRKTETGNRFVVDLHTGDLPLPVEIYGLEFQDLRLPVPAQLPDSTMNVMGQFTLASGDASERALEIVPQNVKRIDLITTLTDAAHLPAETTIGDLTVEFADGHTVSMPLRVGHETCAWNNPIGQCRAAVSWQKKLALLGTQRYPEAWSDFTAHLYSSSFSLSDASQIRALRLRRAPSQGDLSVWGIRLVSP